MWVWIDDRNPIFRAGLAGCLRAPGFGVAGESSELVPEPDLERADVVVFDAGDRNIGWAREHAGAGPVRLVGVVGAGRPDGPGVAGLCTVLVRSALTPQSFLACLRSLTSVPAVAWQPAVAGRPARPGGPGRAVGAGLSPMEIDVLRHLADGRSPREIGRLVGSSERAVRSVVDDLVGRLRCRTPVQAVALALREGVI